MPTRLIKDYAGFIGDRDKVLRLDISHSETKIRSFS